MSSWMAFKWIFPSSRFRNSPKEEREGNLSILMPITAQRLVAHSEIYHTCLNNETKSESLADNAFDFGVKFECDKTVQFERTLIQARDSTMI